MKYQEVQSVVQTWVSVLPFTQQALLMLATRGPDGAPKLCTAKPLVHYLRGAILRPAYPYSEDDGFRYDGFMCGQYDDFQDYAKAFLEDHDAYPHHFIMHLIHAAEVIGNVHPADVISGHWLQFYWNCCKCLHMNPETKEQLFKRLSK